MCFPLSGSSLNKVIPFGYFVKMQCDVSSRCGILAERKQDRAINQGKQTLFLSKTKITLSVCQKKS